MKKFTFTLEKVLAWRRIQVQIAEAELERLHAELRGVDAAQKHLQQEGERVERDFLEAASATAPEFVALGEFRKHVDEEETRIAKRRVEMAETIAQHATLITAKRRDLKLLEKLKEQRLHSWTEEVNKETAQLAEESYLARWKPPPLD